MLFNDAAIQPPELVRRLAEAARRHPLREKLVVASSYRVGTEWLDWTARLVGGVVNMRLITPKRLLADFAEDELRRRSLRLPSAEETVALVGRIFSSLRGSPETGYFTRLPPSLPLVETLANALDELEAAGLSSLRQTARHFASREKFDELAQFHRHYRQERARAGCADQTVLLECALSGLRRRKELPLLLVPESVRESADAHSRALLDAWPDDLIRTLGEDDGEPSVPFACRVADSTANEARQVMRTLFRDGIPLDAVEIIVTDARTCIPALCEAGMETFGCSAEDLPFTFHGGIPASYSRPARLLSAWLAWLNDSLPPSGLARMIRGRLLGDGWRAHAPAVRAEDLAARLLQLPVYGTPEEYRLALGRNRDNGQMNDAEAWLARHLDEILPLANGGQALDLESAPVVLGAADRLIRLADHTASKLDSYAGVALAATIAARLPHCDWPGFRPSAWLESLVATLQVMGLGPQPGMAHVADMYSGGFSGRRNTFILGLDDTRFPGGSRQDPVLLDKERLRLSRSLPVSGHARERRETAMRRLLARLRGAVTLSYARHDAEADREQYPSLLFNRFAEASPPSAPTTVLRPAAAAESTCRRDALLWTVLSRPRNTLTPADFAPWHPRLAQGWTAHCARLGDEFTIYDGLVPEAGADYSREPWAISPTDMETLAANPADYFYKRILKILPPDRFEPTPGKWLEGNERGNIIHDLFQDFVKELIDNGDVVRPEALARHRIRLLEMLDRALERYRRRKPVRDELAYARERGEMIESCVIFLRAEMERNAEARPIRLEAALGGATEDAPPWEQTGPVELPLPSGDILPLKGRIDRIDRLHNHGGLVIWDYKTGRSDKFSPTDPFRQGRHLQPLLYCLMLDHTLRRHGLPEPINRFSYFFPMPRDEGRVFTYTWSQLSDGGIGIVSLLRQFLSSGCFPVSPLPKDRVYSDYAALFPAAPKPVRLAPWLELRGEK